MISSDFGQAPFDVARGILVALARYSHTAEMEYNMNRKVAHFGFVGTFMGLAGCSSNSRRRPMHESAVVHGRSAMVARIAVACVAAASLAACGGSSSPGDLEGRANDSSSTKSTTAAPYAGASADASSGGGVGMPSDNAGNTNAGKRSGGDTAGDTNDGNTADDKAPGNTADDKAPGNNSGGGVCGGATVTPPQCGGAAIAANLRLALSGFDKCSCFNGTFTLTRGNDGIWASAPIHGCPGQTTPAYLKLRTWEGGSAFGITDECSIPGAGWSDYSPATSMECAPFQAEGGRSVAGNINPFCPGSEDAANMVWRVTR